ncbi:hypothetical protein ASPBRDRAFT_186191 [Aspergillus brasiliensis CBS 101740]|uniref:Zn(2)-C6 fungal-type domain-containing protein n=1 Tax=Aspergillus brasiliensis (strain CBS 101740 / IMI 381727 / IBT 21946) TaxID=767769 RepID=A0A1L9U7J4_ASPBC|nr:hypothetical protein ASPBRDRAFT_186191 [Aspergillus brasiliensis CBS 101740]
MSSNTPTGPQGLNRPKLACSLCARRKVKCDKRDPCSNCIKAQARCLYEAPASPRPRKRAADEELVTRLAQYEELMRKHNIDFSSLTHTWVTPNQESHKKSNSAGSSAAVGDRTGVNIPSRPTETMAAERELCLWSDLSPELKYPSMQSLRHQNDPLLYPTPSLEEAIPDTQSIHNLHPEPRHIYRLWQLFVERVDPTIKIVHVPTLQQRILDASYNPTRASKPLTAIIFGMYTISVTSISSDECEAYFGRGKAVLLARYRTATLRALIAVDFLSTNDLEVLQALAIFLFSNPGSDLATTLSSAAVRLAEKMGLHQEPSDPSISFFEKEMRIRLWWQLRGLDARCRINSTPGIKKPPPPSEIGDVRLPLNVNDADLHPDMTEPPLEHNGPTEMMCVLLKMEVSNWRRHSPIAVKLIESVLQNSVRTREVIELESKAVDELEEIYHRKYFRNYDPHIPLHKLAHAIANLSIARFKFNIYHPRGRLTATDGETYMSPDESDILFESALTWTQSMMDIRLRSKFPYYLFTHLTTDSYMDAYIYLLSELRRRCSGDRVALAWQLVEDLFNEHPELIDDNNQFFAAFTDLTLEAWEARRDKLTDCDGGLEAVTVPSFIQRIYGRKGSDQPGGIGLPPILHSHELGGVGLQGDKDTSWLYWEDFLQL